MRKSLEHRMFVPYCTITTHHTSSAHSSEKTVTKYQIIPLGRILFERSTLLRLFANLPIFWNPSIIFKKIRPDNENFRIYVSARLKNIVVIKVGLGLGGFFSVTLLHAFLVHPMLLHRPNNERSSSDSVLHRPLWLSKKKRSSFVVLILTGLRGMQIATQWCKTSLCGTIRCSDP